MGVPEKIKQIEDEIAKTQVNKNTNHHLGILRAKIAKLKREQEDARNKGKSSSTGGYDVKKSGDGTVAIVGLPNVGKSTLLNQLTNSKSKVGSYKFTTLTVVPGIMEYKGAAIQILDLPGIIEQAAKGRGLGKRILSVARNADLILLMIDVFQPEVHPLLRKELMGMGIRPDEEPPETIIEKTRIGGVAVTNLVDITKISHKLVKDILHVYKIHNARVIIREDISVDQLIDIILGNRSYVGTLTALNKVDLVNKGYVKEIEDRLKCKFIPISADANLNLDTLKEQIYQRLDFIRIYLRPKGGHADKVEPLIMKNGSSVLDVCNKLHREMKKELRYARIWGNSVKFGGQRVGLAHSLMDEDILTIFTR